MLALKTAIQDHGLSQAELARLLALSPATIAQLVNKEIWPSTPTKASLLNAITEVLTAKGIAVLPAFFESVPVPAETTPIQTEEVKAMLLRKVNISKRVRQHFGIFKDPFDDDINCSDDVFITGKEQRYVFEEIRDTWMYHGFKAIVGESGAGKTTLKDRMLDDLRNESVTVITPKVAEMDCSLKMGKPLRMNDIHEAIIATLSPMDSVKRSSQARQRQVHQALINSSRNGNKNLLLIEEAHDMAIPTLRHIKRLREEKDGTRTILGVLLIGQPELAAKLNMQMNWEAREVIQRCEVITMQDLGDDLDAYLRFKFERVGKQLDEVFEKGALDAVRSRLIVSRSYKNKSDTVSLMYPLMVNNLVASAMVLATELNFSKVSSDLIKEA